MTANADKGAMVNLVELDRLTGFDRGTLSKWALKRGMPTERTGARGVDFKVNVRRFITWREKLVVEKAIQRWGSCGAATE